MQSLSPSGLFPFCGRGLGDAFMSCQLMEKESSNKDRTKGGTKSFVLRLDTAMMNAIEAWAADEFRSTNGQIQWILAEALKKSGRMKKDKEPKETL